MLIRRSRILITPLLIAAAVVAPIPAYAQIGGLVKKAVKKAAGEAAADAAGDRTRRKLPERGNAASPDVIGAELTADTLDLVLKGLAAVAEKRASIRDLRIDRDRAAERRSAFLDANGSTIEAYQAKRNAYEECSSSFERELDSKRAPELQRRSQELANSPNRQQILEEFNRMTLQVNEAMQRGDSATMRRLQRQYQQKFLGIDAAADSAAEVARCGKPPMIPKQLADRDRLNEEVGKLDDRIREAEMAAEGAGPRVSGLAATRFALARERLITWVSADRSGTAPRSFSDREHRLFSSRRGDIVRLLDASSR